MSVVEVYGDIGGESRIYLDGKELVTSKWDMQVHRTTQRFGMGTHEEEFVIGPPVFELNVTLFPSEVLQGAASANPYLKVESTDD